MIIKNGLLIDPVRETSYVADLKITDGKIAEIGENLLAAEGEEVIDASGKCVAPGLIDGHVHFRDPGQTYKEDILTGSKAVKPVSSAILPFTTESTIYLFPKPEETFCSFIPNSG